MSTDTFVFRGNDLYCEGSQVTQIAREFGTPLYVYSKNHILDRCRTMKRALGEIPHLVCYALKANSNPSLLALIREEGIGAEVVSGGELYGALKCGFPPERIIFSGVGKRDDEIELALEKKIFALNVESLEELKTISELARRRGIRAPIFFRVNPDIEAGGHPYISTGRKHDKFGIEPHDVVEAFRWAKNEQSLDCIGLHAHIGSQVVSVEPYRAAAQMIVGLARSLQQEGMKLRAVNMGGGFGVRYADVVCDPRLPAGAVQETVPSAHEFLAAVLPLYRALGCTVLCEPGRAIVANAGALIVRVLYRKQTASRTFVVVDGGMNDLIRPTLYQAYHQIVPVEISGRVSGVVDVVGPICESGDFFALERSMPNVVRGDHLAILTTGAYGYVFSSNYNGRPRGAEVLVDDREVSVIRQREKVENLI